MDVISLAVKTLRKMGYKTTTPKHKNANGPDVFAIKKDSVLSVEIKKAYIANKGRSVLRVSPVEPKRINDDLIAIVMPFGYVLVEPMRDHLKACSNSGERFLNY